MGMFDWLFKPTSTPVSSTQSTTTTLGQGAQDVYNTMLPDLKNAASQPWQTYGGPTVAQLTPDQIAAQNAARTAAGGSVQGLANAGTTAQNYMLDPARLDVTHDPNVLNQANAVREMTMRGLNENTLPSLNHGAIQTGGMFSGGNTRDAIAQGKAIGDTNLNLSKTLSDLFSGAYNQAAGRMQTAQGQNSAVMGNELAPASILGAVGTQNQTQDQAQINAQISKYYTDLMMPFLKSGELLSMIQGMPGATTTSTGTGMVPGPSPFQTGVGALTGGLGAAGLLGWKPFGGK